MTVRRWRRYGADRLFVVGRSGSPLGSIDLTSGKVDVVEAGHETEVRRAVQEYLRGDSDEVVVPRQHGPVDGLTVEDEVMLAAWFGAAISWGGTVNRREAGVRAHLERLGDIGWTVLHSVPIGLQGTVCAHVLVGPQGVFTVHRTGRPGQSVTVDGGSVMVDGRPTAAMRDAALEARRVRSMLISAGGHRVVVRPVLVVTGTLDVRGPGPSPGPVVLRSREVVGALRSMPETLRLDEQASMAQIARRATTWMP
jgi:hypothetical protein